MTEKNSWLGFLISHPTAANLLMAIFIFAGVMTARDLRRETLPDFTPGQVEITAAYPGARAEDVETAVCQRIEDALEGLADLEEIRAEARENLARVVVEMKEDGDLNRFFADVRTEVEAIDDFPDKVEKPVINLLGQEDLVVSVAVTGPMSPSDLKTFCENLRDRLKRSDLISQVDLKGFSDRRIRIELNPETLMQHGLSASDVADRIAAQSVDLPAGSIETDQAEIMVRFADERRKVDEFRDLVIFSGAEGAELRLGELARISDGFELDEEKIIFNGRRAGMLTVTKSKSEDALRIMEAVQDLVDRETKRSPPGVKLSITQNVSKIVRDRLVMLVKNGLEGFVLVFLAMWLFFSFRYSFWVAMGLPVSFLGAVFVMQLIDFSLNMITMVGLLMAIGLLMDDAIVISENVAAHLERGKSPFQAAVDGVREVAGGVMSSFLTTLVVFGPLALLISGSIGQVLWVMPVVLILTLTVSLVEAFLILPNHLVHSLEKGANDQPGLWRLRIEKAIDWTREVILGKTAAWAVSYRYLFLGLVGAAFLASLSLSASGRIKFEAFPEVDGDVLQARVLLPQGTPLARSEAAAERISGALEKVNEILTPKQPGGRKLVENINLQFNYNPDANEAGPHVFTVSADLLSAEKRSSTLLEISNLWRREVGDLPDVLSVTYKEPSFGPAGLPIDIRLKGENLDELKRASLDLMNRLNSYQGVLDLSDDLRPGKPEVTLRLKEGASVLGVTAALAANQLRAAFYGFDAAQIQRGGEAYEVNVRLSDSGRDSLADLDGFHLTTPAGDKIPLYNVVDVEYGRGYARIQRIDSVRTVTIQGDVDLTRANAAEIIDDVRKNFLPGFLARHPGIEATLEGQAKETGRTMGSMRKSFLIGIFGIFIILSFQFRSYLEPLTVMAAIPLALIGVIGGHWLMGVNLSMPSVMGFVSLAGIVVNDSILLVQFIRRSIDQGLTPAEAATTASRQRFRAVILSSLTTIMGLIPLMMEKSLQAQILIPLAVSIVFGLLASTVLVLLVIPTLYTVFSDLGLTRGPEKEA